MTASKVPTREEVEATLTEDIPYSQAWQKAYQHSIALLDEVERLESELAGWKETAVDADETREQYETENTRLRERLPAEMQDCTILFRECEKGHGRLTAENWVDHGCSTCEADRLRERVAELEKAIQDAFDGDLGVAGKRLNEVLPQ